MIRGTRKRVLHVQINHAATWPPDYLAPTTSSASPTHTAAHYWNSVSAAPSKNPAAPPLYPPGSQTDRCSLPPISGFRLTSRPTGHPRLGLPQRAATPRRNERQKPRYAWTPKNEVDRHHDPHHQTAACVAEQPTAGRSPHCSPYSCAFVAAACGSWRIPASLTCAKIAGALRFGSFFARKTSAGR